MAVQNFFRNIGWSFNDTKNADNERLLATKSQNVVSGVETDGGVVLDASGRSMYSVTFEGAFRTERDLILKYREVATQPEVDLAVDYIVNDAISYDAEGKIVNLNLDNLKFSDNVKNTIQEEFANILKLLDFEKNAYEFFRQWYVDGRIAFQVKVGEENPKDGILELVNLSPLCIKKVREETKEIDHRGVEQVTGFQNYYIYTNEYLQMLNASNQLGQTFKQNQLLKMPEDSVVYVTSGLYDEAMGVVKSYLHKAIKPINQVRMMEDAIVIYRLARAPERRVIYVEVGTLPKTKAEQYVQSIMNKFKNKMVYDSSTGTLVDSTKALSMMEDFYLPRRDGSKGTEITTLPGGENLGKIDDLEPLMRKLYRSLNVPLSRLETNDAFNIGRASEITRDEMMFSKFIDRLRLRFGQLFIDLLKRQLVLKGLITLENWEEIREDIKVEFSRDNFMTELKESEILRDRLNMLDTVAPHVGIYFSKDFVRKNVLRMTEEQIAEMDKQIKDERTSGDYEAPENEISNMSADVGFELRTTPYGQPHVKYE